MASRAPLGMIAIGNTAERCADDDTIFNFTVYVRGATSFIDRCTVAFPDGWSCLDAALDGHNNFSFSGSSNITHVLDFQIAWKNGPFESYKWNLQLAKRDAHRNINVPDCVESDDEIIGEAFIAESVGEDAGEVARIGPATLPRIETGISRKIVHTFEAFDTDGNGLIDLDELGNLLKKLEPSVWTDNVLRAFLGAVDMNGDGMIEFQEFVQWLRETPIETGFDASHKGDLFEAGEASMLVVPRKKFIGGSDWESFGAIECGTDKPDRLRLQCLWKQAGPEPQARIRAVLRRGGIDLQMNDCFGICPEGDAFAYAEKGFSINDKLISLAEKGDAVVFEHRVGPDFSYSLDIREFAAVLSKKTCPPGMEPCKWGAFCYNKNPDHRKTLWHPRPTETVTERPSRACKYGTSCYMKNVSHLETFAHPGDRKYKHGLVVFPPGKGPEFQTLWELFSFFDLDETGHVTKDEFEGILLQCKRRAGNFSQTLEDAWREAGGEADGYLNFARVATWAEKCAVTLPVGLDLTGGQKPCHFRLKAGRCSCAHYEPDPSALVCVCGHKQSMHRSDVASLQPSEVLAKLASEDLCKFWTRDEGLVEVKGQGKLFNTFQRLLNETHKTEDNWTRDRGCALHGRDGPSCSTNCMFSNRAPVPTGYRLRKVFRNQNRQLLQNYLVMKKAVLQECNTSPLADYQDVSVLSQADCDPPLTDGCNDWRLLHGTGIDACKGICGTNFRLSLSGSGATWKEPGSDVGSPLYGFGIYLGERVTKADEYSQPIPAGQQFSGLYPMLVVRCVGGRANVVTTNEINKDKLRDDVFDGPYHSVFGDRVSYLGKPYREIVVYDKDQIYPEFMLLYERCYD